MNGVELLNEGKRLLELVYSEKDSFIKMGINNDVIPELEEDNLAKWVRNLELFLVNVKNERVKGLIESNLWVKNGRRVNVHRMSNIIDILSEYMKGEIS